jgi:hypothetical protein
MPFAINQHGLHHRITTFKKLRGNIGCDGQIKENNLLQRLQRNIEQTAIGTHIDQTYLQT